MPEEQTGRAIENQATKVSQSASQLTVTAGAVKQSATKLTSAADRQLELAADRTLLAAERTYAAWIRTGLASLASGVAAHTQLGSLHPAWLIKFTGSILFIFSAVCFAGAVWRHLRPLFTPPKPDMQAFPALLVVPLSGFLVLVACAALISVWW
jgi:putative membrane protein